MYLAFGAMEDPDFALVLWLSELHIITVSKYINIISVNFLELEHLFVYLKKNR
jgi:hypothetical protein